MRKKVSSMLRRSITLALIALFTAGCPEPEDQTLRFDPNPVELPDALPGFTSSTEFSVINGTGQTWTLTALAMSSADEGAERFDVVIGEGGALPVDLLPGEHLPLTIVFSPETVRTYGAVLTGSLSMSDFVVGGGGCSAGCGEEAPEDLTQFVAVTVIGTGNEEAQFEDCEDGIDNDGDGLVDCDDPDCLTFPNCSEIEFDCGNGLDDDGDGLVDCDDPDCANDPECGGDPEICDDGIDNDGDGRVDCEDADCADFPGCISIDGCDPQGELFCGGFVQSDTGDGTNEWEDYCDSGFDGFSGPEHVWGYYADSPGEVYVAATAFGGGGGPGPGGGGWDLDLTILEARGEDGDFICDPTNCVATSWSPPGQPTEETFFDAQSETLYLIVIDGWDGASGEYELFLECEGGSFENECDDGLDNDSDGLADCDDPDCFGTPECAPDGYCQPAVLGECGGFYSASNDADFSTNEVTDYCDNGFDGWTGPEVAMFYFPDVTGEVTVSLTGLSEDLDLTVLLADIGAGNEDEICNPDLCIDEDWAGGSDPEEITFDAFAGTGYIFVVDGWDGAVSNFDLTVECDIVGVEFCDNGLDDDGDGLVDCDDPDCVGFPGCIGGTEICDDGIDNDGDGDADCDDILDCQAFPGCDYGDGDCCSDNGSPGCENELGEDCVCAIDPYCCNVEWDGICADEFENQCGGTCDGPGTEICDDGIDNDGDGFADCDDADCGLFPDCVTPGNEFDCDNTVDDDGDGLVDCADPDCATDPVCLPGNEDCTNGLDDDGDGLVDCDDGDCTFESVCDAGDGDCCVSNGSPGCDDEAGEDLVCDLDPFCCNVTWDFICADEYQDVFGGTCADEICDNGLDDDADGATDCDDSDCTGDPACPDVEICDNGLDDDADGFIDCDDLDCQGTPDCAEPLTETDCTNNIDDDFDGPIDCADSDCFADPACVVPGTETNCANGLDDDGDGATDCDDSDCTADPNCNINPFETSCVDGIDNDADGDIDCDDSDCASFPGCVNPPEANCVNGIDDDADGLTDCNDSDCAFDPACATGEDCDDGVDNDGDGDVDCADSDCSADIACVDPGVCSPIQNITCGDVIASSNDAFGSTNVLDEWCGNPLAPGWTGPEITYLFTPTADGFVDMTLSGLTADLDIQAVVEDEGCDAEDCEANGWNPPPDDEQIDWFAFAGQPYYIVIDGWNGAISSFNLTVTCTPLQETGLCDNGLNDDGDGDTDCADVDCLGDAACPELICDDGIDNDADAAADCNDTDCFGTPTCIPETNCVDGIDNDSDGDTDCDDTDCASLPACDDGGEPDEEICGNGLDDDGDGQTDCDDTDCAGDPGCSVVLFSSVDDDPQDFIHFGLANHGSSVVWEQGIPDTSLQTGAGPTGPYAGTAAWCTGCEEDPVNGGRFNAYLIVQPFTFDLSSLSGGTLELNWRHWQVSPGFPATDLTRLEASDDGGNTINVEWGPFAASTGGWSFEVIDLSGYLGGDLTLGFRLDSMDGFDSGDDGWYLDDVELIYYP
ncbi:MAG: hypothetical protein GY898_34400 [Proteobacteria bacterium]|nr:hypothetical protein [Pseudomonadota bacterium]